MSAAELLQGYPWVIPGLMVSLALSIIMGPRVGPLFGVRPPHGSAIVMSLGFALSATLTPGADALASGISGSGVCDLGRMDFATWGQVKRADEVALNLILLLPLGASLATLPRSARKGAAVALALVLPFVIEVIQLVAIPLGRACQSGDVIDNVTGLAIGLGSAAGIWWILVARSAADARLLVLRAGVVVLVGAALAAGIMLTAAPRSAMVPMTLPPVPTTPAPPAAETVRVTSVAALLAALADDALSEIVVADGTYEVSRAADQAPDSLWIGRRFADRTRPITVRAETVGGVTFDGGGVDHFGGITFVEGAHHQTWQGFQFANGTPTSTGVIVFGGYAGEAAPHHITLRSIALLSSITSTTPGALDHGVYFSRAVGGPHDILIDGMTVDGVGGLDSALHFFGSDEENANAWNVTVRRLQVAGTEQAIIIWDPTVHDITIDTATIVDPLDYAVRYESPGATGIVLANITSSGSGSGRGFHSSLGPVPPGVTFEGSSLN